MEPQPRTLGLSIHLFFPKGTYTDPIRTENFSLYPERLVNAIGIFAALLHSGRVTRYLKSCLFISSCKLFEIPLTIVVIDRDSGSLWSNDSWRLSSLLFF